MCQSHTAHCPGEIPPPLTPLQLRAAHHHEIYRAWCEAGFTPDQALTLLATVITTPPPGYSHS